MGDYITVVGGVNVDIGGFSRMPLREMDSNPGTVSVSLGGVGRNVAHNLCLMGCDVRLVTVYGQDENGAMAVEGCERIGLDMSLSQPIYGMRTSSYLFIADSDRNMRLAISDMDIYEAVTPAFLERRMEAINGGRAVVVDANIPEESIRYLAERAEVPVIADPVSGAKAGRLLPAMSRLAAIKPNALEAAILTGEDTSTRAGIERAADALIAMGAKRAIITMGERGVLCQDQRERVVLPAFPAVVKNATGAGDAFTAGVCVGVTRGWSMRRIGLFAQAAAVIAIASEETVNPNMSMELLEEIISEQPDA